MTPPKLQALGTPWPDKWIVHKPVDLPPASPRERERPLWGIVSDDLTGLQAIAGEFARLGFVVGTAISHLPERRDLEAFEVFGFDTATRPLDADEAEARVGAAARHLLASGVTRLFKHNDSIMQGHIARELRALAEACGDGSIVYSPACPNRGRVTVGGVQREVDASGELVKGGLHVDLAAELAACGVATRLLDLASLRARKGSGLGPGPRRGEESDPGQSPRLGVRGKPAAEIIVADATTDQDLDLLVEAAEATGCRVLAGSVGLAAALARRAAPWRRCVRPVLVIAGSLQGATRQQTARLLARTDCASVQLSLCSGPREGAAISAAIGEAREALARGLHCVVWSAPDAAEAPGSSGYPTLAREALEKLRSDLWGLIAGIVDDPRSPIGGLVVAGGSTADLALRDTLRVTRFSGLAWLCEGMTMAITADGARPGLPVITKSGGWGPPDALCTAVDQLTAWRCTHAPELERTQG